MFWAGLRGAVAVAAALSLPIDVPERALLQEVTFGIVLFTLLVQGTTAGLVVRRTGAAAPTPATSGSATTRVGRHRAGLTPDGSVLGGPGRSRPGAASRTSPRMRASRQTRQRRSTSSSRSTAASGLAPIATAPCRSRRTAGAGGSSPSENAPAMAAASSGLPGSMSRRYGRRGRNRRVSGSAAGSGTSPARVRASDAGR